MPMPKPENGEERGAFINRCMGDVVMNGEFPEPERRRAVCEKQWDEPMGMSPHGDCRLSIDDCRMVLRATDYAGQAETIDVLIAPDGKVQSTKGDFTVDEESSAAMDRTFREHATFLPIDYEHQTLGGDYASPDGTAPAAGWVKGIRYEKGKGVIASVAWTERARNMIRAGEYQYVSPVLIVRKADGKAIGLHSVGLTNRPAIVGMKRIAAKDVTFPLVKGWARGQEDAYKLAAGQRKDRAMNELLLIGKDLGLAEADCKVETITNKIGELKKRAEAADAPGATVEAICKELGLPKGAGAEAISIKLKLMQEASANSDKNVARLADVEKQLTEIRVNKLHAMLDEKVKVNAINPNDDIYKALKALAATNPESFVVIVNGLKPVIAPGRTMPPEGGMAGGDKSRETIIANSGKKFREDASLQKLTTCKDFVSLALQDAGQDRLSVDEAKKIAA